MSGLDFDMGRHAAFIWPAFAASAVVIAGLIADTLARSRRWRREAERRERERS
jgi:heme exporter protein D